MTTTSSTTITETYSAAGFYIESLPGQPNQTIATLTQYAGHLPSHPSTAISPTPDSHLWFWLIRESHISDRPRLVIWFNGGPGCSSLEGALMEIGPLRVKHTEKLESPIQLEISNNSWSQYSSLLFIDQPAGTGYSFVNTGDDVRELDQAANQVVVFLTNFYKTFPEFSTVDTYLAGQSYAGQYIPYIAQAILETTTLPTVLKGILMGNAWINPDIQYPAYLDFAYERGLLVKGSKESIRVEQIHEKCSKALKDPTKSDHVLISECETILSPIIDGGTKRIDGVKMKPISYNITQFSEDGDKNWPPVVKSLTRYLDQPETAHAFHAEAKSGKWEQCNDTIAKSMWSPNSRPSYTLLPKLLTKMKVLLYAGDQDFMCNALGIERSIEALEWSGQKGFGKDKEGKPINSSEYIVNGENVGRWTEARGLSLVVIDRASHLVPIDAPVAALDMLLRFISVDPLTAAGPASMTTSSVGNKTLGPLAKTFANNGSLISNVESSTSKEPASLPLSELSTDSPEREAYYGPRRTLTLVLLLVGSVASIIGLLKWTKLRRHRRVVIDNPEIAVRLKTFTSPPPDPKGSEGEADRLLNNSKDDRRLREQEEVFGIGPDEEEDG
ncbi:hypothetical protein CROQUDRAFT_657695 [Cronartium quercuum f. sp. fusiforme G11]|uniref:Pheromone-processing carboxypeptidase KEX1 n=1 Tax=Cronartium quercuum f. sp. fusiforme G11 TaxID=708437 RepID=A0A9P6NLI1_9BASI|nr:hypothetical protein CROQUDRAFT_657695 [Cronartium quercuum f. sp. fusiforme G11]